MNFKNFVWFINPLMPNSDLWILLCQTPDDFTRQSRASGRSRKKKSNFAGFSGTNSREKRPISREFFRPVSLKNDWLGTADFVGECRANFAGK